MTPPIRRNPAQPALWVVGLLLLAVLAMVGVGQSRLLATQVGRVGTGAAHAAVLQTAPTGPEAGAPASGGPLLPVVAPVRIEERDAGVAFYFAEDAVQMPPDAAKSLGVIVRGVAAGQTAIIQPYPHGDASSRRTAQRVLSVHNLLVSVGIGEDKIRRADPEPAPAWAQAGDDDCVEVVLDAG